MDESKGLIGSELCRLCLKEAGETDLFEKRDMVQDIYLCTGVKVVRSNNLPRKICIQCSKIVKHAKQLRLMVQKNEMHMRILFDHEDPVTNEMDELNSEKKCILHTTESRSSDNKDTTDEEDNNINRSKRRKSVSEREPLKKDCTYIEGMKYGISKTSTVDDMNVVTVTYTCSMCPKTFPSWKQIYRHQRMHNKNIECPKDRCKKKFATNADLRKHVRTHTGERPYACNICDRSFSQRGTLKSHKENVHHKESKLVD